MATVYLVDDDILTLNRLRGLVDWAQLGYEIIGHALDGDAALAQMKVQRPDLLILDINMPRKSGLAVAKSLHGTKDAPYILILSNHDTFEYVRTAMQYGVKDYLLKHELSAALLTEKLTEIRRLLRDDDLSARFSRDTAAYGKQRYLRRLALGTPQAGEQHALMAAQAEFASGLFCIALLRIHQFSLFTFFDGDAERERLMDSAVSLSGDVLSATGAPHIITPMPGGALLLLLPLDTGKSQGENMEKARALTAMLAASLGRMLGITAYHHTHAPLASTGAVEEAYAACENALGTRHAGGQAPPLNAQDEQALMDALAALDGARAARVISSILAEQGPPAAWHLLRISRLFARRHALALPETYLRQLQNSFRTPLSMEAMEDVLQGHFRTLLTQAVSGGLSGHSTHVQAALSYLHAGHAGDISLATAASSVGISSAYLSRQFHKEVGQSFVDYLTRYRIARAQTLLARPGATIKGVSAEVGFQNYNYFLRVFKKITGQTAKEFLAGTRA